MPSRVDPECQQQDLQQSLAPLLTLLRLIGISLNEPGSPWLQRAGFMTVVVIHFLNVLNCVGIFEAPNIWVEEKKKTESFSINVLVDTLNMAVYTVGISFLFSFDIRKKWMHLWRSLQDIKLRAGPDMCQKLRKRSLIGIAYIIVSVNSICPY